MARYLILYNALEPSSTFMAKFTPEQIQAGMKAWMDWKDGLEKSVVFDFGMPVEAVSRVNSDGVLHSDNLTSGYSTMEADSKDLIIAALRTHPHLQNEGATIDVLEMLSMGTDAVE